LVDPVEVLVEEPFETTITEPVVPMVEVPVEVVSEVEALLAEIENLPEPVMTPVVSQNSSAFTLAVDKVKKQLLVLEEAEESFRVVERYKISYGEKKGDKVRE